MRVVRKTIQPMNGHHSGTTMEHGPGPEPRDDGDDDRLFPGDQPSVSLAAAPPPPTREGPSTGTWNAIEPEIARKAARIPGFQSFKPLSLPGSSVAAAEPLPVSLADVEPASPRDGELVAAGSVQVETSSEAAAALDLSRIASSLDRIADVLEARLAELAERPVRLHDMNIKPRLPVAPAQAATQPAAAAAAVSGAAAPVAAGGSASESVESTLAAPAAEPARRRLRLLDALLALGALGLIALWTYLYLGGDLRDIPWLGRLFGRIT